MKLRRLKALIIKELLQIARDPSSILIAVILPFILLFIFGYGVNLDNNKVRVGLVLETSGPDISSLSQAFSNSRFLNVIADTNREALEQQLVAGKLRGIIIVPQDFTADAVLNNESAKIQVIADGSEPNIASFVQAYVQGVFRIWMIHQAEEKGLSLNEDTIDVQTHYWYNPDLKSRNFLIPGSIAIVMTLIGTLLTALVIAREWERGTMEAMMATPISIMEILLGKLIPYFMLGVGSMLLCTTIAVFWYDVPLRGGLIALILCTSVFLFAALGQGLLISSATKDQFVASQSALMSAFLPAFMLSGFIFEISAMPQPIQWLTHLIAARYFVTCLQTIFLTGNIWPLLIPCILSMVGIAIFFSIMTVSKTKKRIY